MAGSMPRPLDCRSKTVRTSSLQGRQSSTRRITPRRFAICAASHVKPKQHDVAVAHFVFLAFDPQFASLARFGERTKRDQIVVMNHFRSNETAFEIGMDHAR